MALLEVAELTLLDKGWDTLHMPGDIAEQSLPLLRAHQFEQCARLRVVVIAFAMVVAPGVAFQRQRRFHSPR